MSLEKEIEHACTYRHTIVPFPLSWMVWTSADHQIWPVDLNPLDLWIKADVLSSSGCLTSGTSVRWCKWAKTEVETQSSQGNENERF